MVLPSSRPNRHCRVDPAAPGGMRFAPVNTSSGTTRDSKADGDLGYTTPNRGVESAEVRMERKDPASRPSSRRAVGLARNMGGQGLVELLLVIPVFMTLFFGIYEFSRYYSTRLRIRTAVAQGARFAVTGNQLNDPITGDPLPRAVSIRTTILNEVAQFGVAASDISLSPADGGGPDDIVTVNLDYDYQVVIPVMESVFGTGILDFSVSTAVRNEPFFQ